MTLRRPWIISLQDVSVQIAGVTIQGWSSDTDAIMVPSDLEQVTVDRGATGNMLVMTNGEIGGPVSVKLQASSPTVKPLMTHAANVQAGRPGVIHGYMRSRADGWRFNFRSGVMVKYPRGFVIGKGNVNSLMFTWEFQSITWDFSTASYPVA